MTRSYEVRAVDRSMFYHLARGPAPPGPQSMIHHIRRNRSPSCHPGRGCVSSFFVTCVMSVILAIHRPVRFASHAAGIVCCTYCCFISSRYIIAYIQLFLLHLHWMLYLLFTIFFVPKGYHVSWMPVKYIWYNGLFQKYFQDK